MPVEEFFIGPETDITAETVLSTGEILTEVRLPKPAAHRRSLYIKVRERGAFDFALASIAASAEVVDGRARGARIVLGGVAPVPYRVRKAEAALEGKSASEIDLIAVGETAVEGALPLRDNHFKVPLAASLVRKAVRRLLDFPENTA